MNKKFQKYLIIINNHVHIKNNKMKIYLNNKKKKTFNN